LKTLLWCTALVWTALSLTGCSSAVMGGMSGGSGVVPFGAIFSKHGDRQKPDAELTCPELQTDISDTRTDLAATDGKLAYLQANDSSDAGHTEELAKQRGLHDAYQKRLDSLLKVFSDKTCKAAP